jgi:predicted SPOUT superfamily RNA methylase MTH1
VLEGGPWEDYDLKIGTSDKGVMLENATFTKFEGFKHALVYFGGLEGIEGIIEEEAGSLRPEDAESLFDLYLNTCPNQGTMTIRTEEAILVSLSGILPCLSKVGFRSNLIN